MFKNFNEIENNYKLIRDEILDKDEYNYESINLNPIIFSNKK